jgi:general secretion pathway protein H
MWSPGSGSTANGYTLMELLVVLVILGLAATAIPSRFFGGTESVATRSLADTLVAGLQRARDAAIGKNEDVGFVVDVQARSFGTTTEKQRARIPDDISATVVSAANEALSPTQGTITFFPDGSSTGGLIHLVGENAAVSVRVDWLTGHSFVE